MKPGDARDTDGTMVQVIRNEYVTNVPVRVLGDTGPERTQITGLFRRTDALIVSSSVSLLPGTLVRFGEGAGPHGVEGVAPQSVGRRCRGRHHRARGLTQAGERLPAGRPRGSATVPDQAARRRRRPRGSAPF